MEQRPPSRPRWPSSDDNTGFFLAVIVIGLAFYAYALWTHYHGVISGAVMDLFHVEIGVIRHFTDRFDLADRQMAHADPDDVTLGALYGIAHDVGMFWRIPAAIVIVALAFLAMTRAAPSRFKRAFDLDGLIREQSRSFRTTAAFANRHLRLVEPANTPRPADYALTPEEWIDRYALGSNKRFDPAAARQALIQQLGPRWRGLDGASAPVRCLFAVFALHRAEQRAAALQLLGALSTALGDPGADAPCGPETSLVLPAAVVARADAALRDYKMRAPALAVAQSHAFASTAMMALLTAARRSAGVLAPGQFAWLKLVDRGLWYALHSLGFETEGPARYLHPNPRIEAAAARDHWASERVAGVALIEPHVDRALDALRLVAERRAAPQPTRYEA